MFRNFALLPVVVLLYAEPVLADCDTILGEKLLTKSNVRDENAARYALTQSFCNKTFQQMGNSDGFSAGISYELFGADFGRNESSFNSWKNENCGGMSTEQVSSNFRFAASQALSESAIAAWEQCNATTDGLSCVMTPADQPEEVTLLIYYRTRGNLTTNVVRSFISNAENPGGNNPERLYDIGSAFHEGDDSFILVRTDPARRVAVTLTVVDNNNAQRSCSTSAPPFKEINLPPPESPYRKTLREAKETLIGVSISFTTQVCRENADRVNALLAQVTKLESAEPPAPAPDASTMDRQAYERILMQPSMLKQDAEVAVKAASDAGCRI